MLCPVCDTEMLILEFNKIEIDFCSLCSGVWLDEGELELLLQPDSANAVAVLMADLKKSDRPDGKRKCPVCRKTMNPVELSIEPVVEIDKCRYNHGLWFDKGELDQIMSSTGASGKLSSFLNSVFKKKSN
ncbi:MAG: zf-TFIIB domain-containing protein [Victivallales bacterium]